MMSLYVPNSLEMLQHNIYCIAISDFKCLRNRKIKLWKNKSYVQYNPHHEKLSHYDTNQYLNEYLSKSHLKKNKQTNVSVFV